MSRRHPSLLRLRTVFAAVPHIHPSRVEEKLIPKINFPIPS
jgi:hypothetical protein